MAPHEGCGVAEPAIDAYTVEVARAAAGRAVDESTDEGAVADDLGAHNIDLDRRVGVDEMGIDARRLHDVVAVEPGRCLAVGEHTMELGIDHLDPFEVHFHGAGRIGGEKDTDAVVETVLETQTAEPEIGARRRDEQSSVPRRVRRRVARGPRDRRVASGDLEVLLTPRTRRRC